VEEEVKVAARAAGRVATAGAVVVVMGLFVEVLAARPNCYC